MFRSASFQGLAPVLKKFAGLRKMVLIKLLLDGVQVLGRLFQ